jgi:hypothetical protein
MIRQRRIRKPGHIACKEERINAHKRLRRTVEDNIKKIFKERRWGTVRCIYLDHDKEQ